MREFGDCSGAYWSNENGRYRLPFNLAVPFCSILHREICKCFHLNFSILHNPSLKLVFFDSSQEHRVMVYLVYTKTWIPQPRNWSQTIFTIEEKLDLFTSFFATLFFLSAENISFELPRHIASFWILRVAGGQAVYPNNKDSGWKWRHCENINKWAW